MQPYELLEKEWAEFNQLDPAGMVACSSGTAALHLALEAFQLPPGSEVIVPDFTMIACPRAVTMAGLKPVFVDCGDDLNMDWSLLKGKTFSQFPAVMAVHIHGRRMDLERVHSYGEELVSHHSVFYKGTHKVPVIEDLAEAHGIKPHWKTAAAAWSFYRNKVVCGEEGGAVWFRDPDHAKLARQLRCLGFTEEHDFNHLPRGHNYRLADSLALLIVDSIREYGYHTARRRYVEQMYDKLCPPEWRMPPRDAAWVYDVRVPGLTREKQKQIVRALNQEGIEARCSFLPMTLQEEYADSVPVTDGPSKALAASREVFYLPFRFGGEYPMGPGKIEQAFKVIGGFIK